MPGFRDYRYRNNRRRRYKPRRKVPRKTTIYSRKSAASQARQIAMLSKTVKGLDTKMKEQFCHNYYCSSGSINVGNNAYCTPLIEPTQWERTFQATELTDNADYCWLTNMKVRLWAQIEIGTQVASCCAAIVSLKEPMAAQTYHRTGNMNGTSIYGPNATNGEFVYTSPIGLLEASAMYKINPELFNIHSVRHFKVGDVPFTQAGEDATYVTNISDANKEFVLDARIGRTKLQQGYQPGENTEGWKKITHATGVDRHAQRYLLFMANMDDGDEVALRWQMDVKVTTLIQ